MLRCHADSKAAHVEPCPSGHGGRARAHAGTRLPVRARAGSARSHEPRGPETRRRDRGYFRLALEPCPIEWARPGLDRSWFPAGE